MKYTDYTKQGFKVFACNHSKAPATPNGFKDATDNQAVLHYQFFGHDRLIGLPCGEINNIVVVDFDLYKYHGVIPIEEIKEQIGKEFPETLTVKTRRGGIHYYYKTDSTKGHLPNLTEAFGDGIHVDLRGDGGYIIAPDDISYIALDADDISTNFRKYLADAPDWLYDFKKTKDYSSQGEYEPINDSEYKEIKTALSFVSSDDRDLWINFGLALKNTGSEKRGFELWDTWSKKSDKYDHEDQLAKWESFKPTGDITLATIISTAQKAGFSTTYKNIREIDLDDIDERKNHEKEPFPSELLKPPGLIGELIDHINKFSKKEQPILALAGAFSAAGAIMGQRFQTDQGLRTNLYILGVGESGSGKEAARSAIKRLFEECGVGEWAATEDLASDAAILTALEKAPSQVFLLDEIGRFLKTTNQASSKNAHLYNVISVLLKIYGSANQIYRGKAYADAEKQKTIHSPNLCIYGTTVPSTLFEGLTVENITDGFLSRFMVFESEHPNPKPTGRRRMARQDVCKDLIKKVKEIIKTPININVQGNLDKDVNPAIVQMEPAAEAALDDYERYIFDKREELKKEDRIDTTYNRSVQFAEQIALIHAIGRNHKSPVIELQDAEYGIKLVNYISDRIHHIAEHFIARNDHEHEGKRVLNIIRQAGKRGMTASQLTRKTQHMKTHERNDILTTLEDSEQIMSAMDGRTKYFYPKKISYVKENI